MVQLTRLANCAAAAAATILGGYIASGGDALTSGRVVAASAVVALIVASANVLNDRQDVESDSIGKPHRPIPSGRVSLRTAGELALGLAVAAIVVAAGLGARAAVVAALLLAMATAYSLRLKSTVLLGNTSVAFLVASTVVYGAWIAGSVTRDVWVAALVIFPFILAFEILKCVQDHEADAAAGVRTIATVSSPRSAVGVSLSVLAVLALCVAALGLSGAVSLRYAAVTLALCLLPSIGTSLPLVRGVTSQRVDLSVRVMKAAWVTGLAGIAFLR